MRLETMLKGGVVAVGMAITSFAAQAAPVLNGGWFEDTIQAVNVSSDFSPYEFTLLDDAFFRITDAFLVGDIYTVFETGGTTPLLTTSFQGFAAGFGDNATADNGWTSDRLSSAEILLSAGTYSLEVFGDGAGGLPAGFFVRLDSATQVVPVPAALPLLAGGVALLGVARRRKRES
jgi:hypothetical protein